MFGVLMTNSDHIAPSRPLEESSSHYQEKRQRQALYRVLADNIVRQLMETAHRPIELVGFASEIVRAINDGCDGHAAGGKPGSTHGWMRLAVTFDALDRPRISSERTLLRAPRRDDRPFLERWIQDPLSRRSLIPSVLCHVRDHCGEPGAGGDRLDLIVCDITTEMPIGLVSLHHIDPAIRQAELGKVIGDPAYRGIGAAGDATRLLVSYGFETLNLNRIYLRTLGGNLKNIKLNERMGFRFEGVLQQAAVCDRRLADVVQMAMLRSEYLAMQSTPPAVPACCVASKGL